MILKFRNIFLKKVLQIYPVTVLRNIPKSPVSKSQAEHLAAFLLCFYSDFFACYFETGDFGMLRSTVTG